MRTIGNLYLAIAISVMTDVGNVGDQALRIVQRSVLRIQPEYDGTLLQLDIDEVVVAKQKSDVQLRRFQLNAVVQRQNVIPEFSIIFPRNIAAVCETVILAVNNDVFCRIVRFPSRRGKNAAGNVSGDARGGIGGLDLIKLNDSLLVAFDAPEFHGQIMKIDGAHLVCGIAGRDKQNAHLRPIEIL